MPLSGHAMLFTATDLGRMHLLHAERGTALRSSADPPHVRRVLAADWLRNDAIVLGHDDGSISIRDPSSLRVLQTEPIRNLSSTSRLPVADLAVLAEHGLVAAVYGVVPLVRIYDLRKGLGSSSGASKRSFAIIDEMNVPSEDAVIAMKWLPQLESLFTLGVGGNLERFRVGADAKPLVFDQGMCLPVANALYSCVDFSNEGDLLVAGDLSGHISVLEYHPIAAPVTDADVVGAAALERLYAEASSGSSARPSVAAAANGRSRWLSDTPLSTGHFTGRPGQERVKMYFPAVASPKAIQRARFIGPIGYLTSTDVDGDALYLQPDQGWRQSNINYTNAPPKLDTLAERVRFRRMDLVKAESLEGFDYALYNCTPFCGLENNLPNAYMNAVLQMLFFVRPLRLAMFSICHRFATTSEDIAMSIAAELGFLYDMLQRGSGMACETTRLIYAFQQTSQAVALGLVDDLSGLAQAHSNTPLDRRLDKFCRFLLEHLSREESNSAYGFPEHGRATEKLFGARTMARIRAISSGMEATRVHTQFVLSLSNGRGVVPDAASFEALVAASLQSTQEPIRALHPKSQRVELVEQSREVLSLPPCLLCSCTGLVVQAIPADMMLSPASGTSCSYSLVGVIAGVRSGDASAVADRSTLASFSSAVAFIRVNGSQPAEASLAVDAGNWYCFNDFTITPVPDVREILSYDPSLLQPILVLYRRATDDVDHDGNGVFHQLSGSLDSPASWESIFALRPVSAMHRRLMEAGDMATLRSRLSFVPLAPGERFLPGALVAIDTEFVLLSRERAEIYCARRHGKGQYLSSASILENQPLNEPLVRRVILEPSRKYVARVTVIRENGQVLVDDYVLPPPNCQIVDYLTRYSGITAPDLQPNRTRHYLTMSKYVYAKLHALERAGCVFVGHGLRSDFRHLNFLLRAEQYRDTAILFRQQTGETVRGRSRLLSLRFLAGCLLRRDIQNRQHQGHDSSEDARAALDLYHVYQELERDGTLNGTIDRLYEYGSRKNWQPDFADPFELVR
jgi:DNA polymerase III epsilon subunit-like protein